MDIDPALNIYIAESRELLEEMESSLLGLELEDENGESLNAIFRAAHTIKGSAGLFGLDDIVAFTHGVETLLDRLRDRSMAVDDDIVALLLSCRDHISDLIEQLAAGVTELSQAMRDRGDELGASLTALVDGEAGTAEAVQAGVPQLHQSPVERIDGNQAGNDNWHISLRFGRNSLRDGMDPLSFLRYLQTLGEIVGIKTLCVAIPAAEQMDPEDCYLGFEINFRSDADKQTIESVFEFILEDSMVRILPPYSQLSAYVQHIQELPEEDLRLGEILVRCGSLTQAELEEALRLQSNMHQQAIERPLGNIVVESGMTTQTVLDAAVQKQSQVRENKTQVSNTVRVDADKLDHLINQIGELVIAGAGCAIDAQDSGVNTLIESVATLSRLVEEVRDTALRLRMVQIGGTFNRFQRVVRDVSRELGKEIDLVISGADTELDKMVVEKIGDPLMHLVRNAMDHGIEPAEVRAQRGKPAVGVLRLNAYHDSGSIVIEVSDDGAGLDRERILRKAVDKGLVQPDQLLDDHEVYNLIFEPGFSTASSVTNLSGRGVGMDVVKRNITALRGSVEIDSRAGQGSTIRVRLPLTLAIIDGFRVSVGAASYVVPLDMVFECVELSRSGQEASHGRDFINLRGEVLPLIRLRQLFTTGGRPPRRENVVVVHYGGIKAGMVVDELMGECQTVIKPLGRIFSHVQGVAGSTILGNGEVALIIDVPGLLNETAQRESRLVGSVA